MPRGGPSGGKPGPAKGSRPRLVTPAERARVRDLHTQGLSRNAIARELGRPWSTITKIAVDEGLSFDRTATAKAVEARQVDMAAQRAQLAQDLLDDAQRLRERAWTRYKVVVAGRDGADIVDLELPPAQDVRAFYGAIGAAVNGHKTATALDANSNGVDGARSMLGKLSQALDAAAATFDADA